MINSLLPNNFDPTTVNLKSKDSFTITNNNANITYINDMISYKSLPGKSIEQIRKENKLKKQLQKHKETCSKNRKKRKNKKK